MSSMIEALRNLSNLQDLEFGGDRGAAAEKQAADLRALIPLPILGHYDRLRARGKKGLALVRNNVCGGCHMSLPIGKITVCKSSMAKAAMRRSGIICTGPVRCAEAARGFFTWESWVPSSRPS